MAHYDGPPFLREGQQPDENRYQLPPKSKRHQPEASKPQVAKPEPSFVGHHSVDPLATLSTPKSTVRRDIRRPVIDYQLILARMQRPDEDVYLLTTAEASDEPTVPMTQMSVVPEAPEVAAATDEPATDEPATDEPATDEPATDEPATDEPATDEPATDEPATEQSHTAEPVTKPQSAVTTKHVTPLLPSQQDPLKQAQQAKIAAALEKQKKMVYANWRPVKLPDRRSLTQAVESYKHQPRDKDLPKPVAQRIAQAPVKSVSPSTPKPQESAPKPQVAPESQTAKATTPSKPAPAQASEPEPPYQFPPLALLPQPVVTENAAQEEWVVAQAKRLDETLTAFHVSAHVVAHTIGPTVTQFQVALAAGVKVNKITNLNDDLKLALAAKDIRIEAPIPGKTTVGIEIPNLHPRPVMLSEVLQSQAFQEAKSPLTIALGVDLFGKPVVTNINKMPHGLIAGATGSGKSVFINSLLTSLLYKATPEQVRLLLIDPKAVELAVYNKLPHLVSPVISEPKAAAEALKWAVEEMENRYQKMAAAGVRNLAQFNEKAKAHGDFGMVLPYIVIIIDELADLMMVAASEVQDYIARITQKARAAGIHLIVATQRPSVDVITGTIKNNIPTRIAFMVASQTDSRTIIDANGAERLLGRGDMLYLGSGASQPIRLQGTFIDEDIAKVVDFVRAERPPRYLFQPEGLLAKAEASEAQDDLFPQVLDYIAQEKHVSTSKLQRVFSIGYNRAANLIDELEMRHYISPANGSKPRDVYLSKDDLDQDES
ncbi:DNA translocase FtsK [Lacticaseibacillus sp. GG6-2]